LEFITLIIQKLVKSDNPYKKNNYKNKLKNFEVTIDKNFCMSRTEYSGICASKFKDIKLSHTDSLFDFVNQLILQTGYFLVC
jgi:hypothetical protein